MALSLVLDVDTGVDDALALALACRLPSIQLVGVTTVAGNVDCLQATSNTRKVLTAIGAQDIVVVPGATRPLLRPHRDARYFHGSNGLGGCELPEGRNPISDLPAPAWLIQQARIYAGELVLVCVAPLTNLAMALLLEPSLPQLLHRVVVMGGAFTVAGNVTPFAEFNLWEDPEAAAIVAHSSLPLTFVGLDVTEHVILSREQWEYARQADYAEARLLAEVGQWAFQSLGLSSFALHDPLALAVAFDPSLVGVEQSAVWVDTGPVSPGRTFRIAAPSSLPEYLIALDVDRDRFSALFCEVFGLPLMQ